MAQYYRTKIVLEKEGLVLAPSKNQCDTIERGLLHKKSIAIEIYVFCEARQTCASRQN